MNKWISVKDRLPEYPQWVLIYTQPIDEAHSSLMYEPMGYTLSYFENGLFSDIEKYERVTHWQPLPEPPKD